MGGGGPSVFVKIAVTPNKPYMRCEILTSETLDCSVLDYDIVVSWGVGCQCFGGTCCLHLWR